MASLSHILLCKHFISSWLLSGVYFTQFGYDQHLQVSVIAFYSVSSMPNNLIMRPHCQLIHIFLFLYCKCTKMWTSCYMCFCSQSQLFIVHLHFRTSIRQLNFYANLFFPSIFFYLQRFNSLFPECLQFGFNCCKRFMTGFENLALAKRVTFFNVENKMICIMILFVESTYLSKVQSIS